MLDNGAGAAPDAVGACVSAREQREIKCAISTNTQRIHILTNADPNLEGRNRQQQAFLKQQTFERVHQRRPLGRVGLGQDCVDEFGTSLGLNTEDVIGTARVGQSKACALRPSTPSRDHREHGCLAAHNSSCKVQGRKDDQRHVDTGGLQLGCDFDAEWFQLPGRDMNRDSSRQRSRRSLERSTHIETAIRHGPCERRGLEHCKRGEPSGYVVEASCDANPKVERLSKHVSR